MNLMNETNLKKSAIFHLHEVKLRKKKYQNAF